MNKGVLMAGASMHSDLLVQLLQQGNRLAQSAATGATHHVPHVIQNFISPYKW